MLFLFFSALFISFSFQQSAETEYSTFAGQMPANFLSSVGYPVANQATSYANGAATGTNNIVQANTGYTSANQNLNYNAAVENTAESALATCAAFVCIEFEDSTAYGTNTVNTYSGQTNQAYSTQGAGSVATQNQQATYNYPSTFSAFSVYGSFPTETGVASAFPFYGASGNTQQNAYAYGNSGSNQATTQHNDYYNDNHAYVASGKKCSKYVCASSTDSATTNQIGPNYNINNAYSSAANQYGPDYSSTYGVTNNAGDVVAGLSRRRYFR